MIEASPFSFRMPEHRIEPTFPRKGSSQNAEQNFSELLTDTNGSAKSKGGRAASSTSQERMSSGFHGQDNGLPTPSERQRLGQLHNRVPSPVSGDIKTPSHDVQVNTAYGSKTGQVYLQSSHAVYHLSYIDSHTESQGMLDVRLSAKTAIGTAESTSPSSQPARTAMAKYEKAAEVPFMHSSKQNGRNEADSVKVHGGTSANTAAFNRKTYFQKRHLSMAVTDEGTFIYARDASVGKPEKVLEKMINVLKRYTPSAVKKIYFNGNQTN